MRLLSHVVQKVCRTLRVSKSGPLSLLQLLHILWKVDDYDLSTIFNVIDKYWLLNEYYDTQIIGSAPRHLGPQLVWFPAAIARRLEGASANTSHGSTTCKSANKKITMAKTLENGGRTFSEWKSSKGCWRLIILSVQAVPESQWHLRSVVRSRKQKIKEKLLIETWSISDCQVG